MDDNLLTERHLLDLSRQAERRGIVVFSDFLTLNELHIFHQNAGRYATGFSSEGGYEFAERQIAAFIPDALSYSFKYPIDCLEISAAHPKFSEKFSHRDILGAVMSLGIERGKIGDILVNEETSYMFCKQEITDYICNELGSIRHTVIRCRKTEPTKLAIKPNLQQCDAIIASNRLDNVTAAMAKVSRSEAVRLIQSGKVFIQGKECLHNTYICKPDDILSIRGFGKFRFDGENGTTRKNRVKITFQKYI